VRAIADGDGRGPPRLRLDLNLATLWNLPGWSAGPLDLTGEVLFRRLRAAGYEGVQSLLPVDHRQAASAGLGVIGLGRVQSLEDLERVATAQKSAGCQATSVIAGTGLETGREVRRFAEGIVSLAQELSHPILLETHRGSITQDIRRTVNVLADVPDLIFTGDLSHWYVGHELPLGDFGRLMEVIEPVLRRVRMIHGRLADAGAVQVRMEGRESEMFVEHFRALWLRCFEGFLLEAAPGEVMVFAPELLPASARLLGQDFTFNYARLVASGGDRVEEGDRWSDALGLCQMARDLFDEARQHSG
jgi:hypothetical protein